MKGKIEKFDDYTSAEDNAEKFEFSGLDLEDTEVADLYGTELDLLQDDGLGI